MRRTQLQMLPRAARIITPVNGAHRFILMAVERGKLQNLIFDNHALVSHRAMTAILGVISKAPPVKQTLASRQMKSIYVDRLLAEKR